MSDLSEFSDSPPARDKREVAIPTEAAMRGKNAPDSPPDDTMMKKAGLTQWAISGAGEYVGVSATVGKLAAGVYRVDRNNNGQIIFIKVDTKVDDLMEFPDSLHESVLKEVDDFWSRGELFSKYGFLHRRGYLFFGPQGSGKTGLVTQIMSRIVIAGDIVILCEIPEILTDALADLRQVEPKRRVVCVFEDVDAIINRWGESSLLALLDGESQIDRVLNIATTNYPERLDKRIVARPRRFDRVIKVGMPIAAVRRAYLQSKLKINAENDDLDMWVDKTEGLSFAALAELVISVKCLGNKFDDTLAILRVIANAKANSTEFDEKKLGIRP